ncbi:MAG: mannonate dehydratase, partial [Cyclobacteriaceae bacterium]
MSQNRRDFIKKGASLAAISSVGANTTTASNYFTQSAEVVKDAGMQMCLAYFWGIEPHKVALARQMDVLGAVGGINTSMVDMKDAPKWEYETIKAVKEAWEKEGLQLRVIEGPPSLYTRTKLGLAGRDEEIENFITFMKNISRLGIDTVCYNWMPVISWARTTLDKPSRGGALVSSFRSEDIKDEPLITE